MIFIIALCVILLDQISKLFIIKNLSLSHSVPLIKGVFHLTLIHNRGAAFGILKNLFPLFVFVSVSAIIMIYFALRRDGYGKFSFYNVSLALILSGALGNLIDRLRFGYVVDFLDFRIWPVFNVADSAITVGAIILGWLICIRQSVK